jgi:hypothetical protein
MVKKYKVLNFLSLLLAILLVQAMHALNSEAVVIITPKK